MRSSGAILCLASAAAFGGMAIFGRLAYGEGATVGTLLSVRFALAAALFWALLAATGGARAVRAHAARDVWRVIALGAAGYAATAACYFAALERIDPSLLSLLVYSYPAIVAATAIALGRERADRRRLGALVVATGGLALVVAGAGTGALDPLGVALAATTAVIYSAYTLVGERVARRMHALVAAALVSTGAAVTLTAGAALLGGLRPDALTAAGWTWVACIAVVSTVAAIGLFFAGLRRVGPTAAATLSTFEPVVTAVLAFLVFGAGLTGAQLLGGGLVLGGALVLARA